MFLLFSTIAGILTFAFLVKSIKTESQQRTILDNMSRNVESHDPNLFTGNSRNPNG